jgi:DNA-binding MarR family transcriptional regulator
MELLLKKIPTEEALREMRERFPDLNVEVMGTYLRYLRVSAGVLNRVESLLNGYGVSPARLPILVLLMNAGEAGIRPSDLAEQVGVTRATMTGLLDLLEKADLIAREADPKDRRALVIKITPAGSAMVDRVCPIHMRNIVNLFRDLSSADHQALRSCLEKIQAGLGRLDIVAAEAQLAGGSLPTAHAPTHDSAAD